MGTRLDVQDGQLHINHSALDGDNKVRHEGIVKLARWEWSKPFGKNKSRQTLFAIVTCPVCKREFHSIYSPKVDKARTARAIKVIGAIPPRSNTARKPAPNTLEHNVAVKQAIERGQPAKQEPAKLERKSQAVRAMRVEMPSGLISEMDADSMRLFFALAKEAEAILVIV